MSKKRFSVDYEEFASVQEMSAEDQQLVTLALEAQKGSYSPYSHFQVGAAERTVLFYAGANYPDVAADTLAIAGSDRGVLCESPASPCGACRQVMAETQKRHGQPLKTIWVGSKRIRKFHSVDDILPFIFDSLTME